MMNPGPAKAQEIQVNGPLAGACDLSLVPYSVPAPLETTYWISGGVAAELDARASASIGGGAEITTGLSEFVGPAPVSEAGLQRQQRRSQLDLRLGPWGQVTSRAPGAVFEGGLTAHLGSVNDSIRLASSLAMFDLRFGAGYAHFYEGRSPQISIGLGWGLRTVFERHTGGGACDPEPPPPLVADATAVRLVVTARLATEFPAKELGLAIEVTPTTIFLPWRIREERQRGSR